MLYYTAYLCEGKIRFPRRWSHEKPLYASLLRCGARHGSPTTNHYFSQIAATLSLGLSAVRDGAFTRFVHRERITLCDTFFWCNRHYAWRHSFQTVWSLRGWVYYKHTTHSQTAQIVQRKTYRRPWRTTFRVANGFRQSRA